MKQFLILISCAFGAGFGRLCGRPVAINAVEAPTAPNGVISATALATRRAALVAAGTPAVYADKLAMDAELQQIWHDHPKSREGEQTSVKSAAEREAAAIAEAQKLEPSKPGKAASEKDQDKRDAVVNDAADAAGSLTGSKEEKA